MRSVRGGMWRANGAYFSGIIMMHQPVFTPKLFTLFEKSIGMPISIYVDSVADEMLDGILADYDDDFLYIQTEYSIDAWRIASLSGIEIFIDADDSVEIVAPRKKRKSTTHD